MECGERRQGPLTKDSPHTQPLSPHPGEHGGLDSWRTRSGLDSEVADHSPVRTEGLPYGGQRKRVDTLLSAQIFGVENLQGGDSDGGGGKMRTS